MFSQKREGEKAFASALVYWPKRNELYISYQGLLAQLGLKTTFSLNTYPKSSGD